MALYLSGKEWQFSPGSGYPGFESWVRHLFSCVRALLPLVWAFFGVCAGSLLSPKKKNRIR